MITSVTIAISGCAIGIFTILLIFRDEKLSRPEIILISWILALVFNQLYFLAVAPDVNLLTDVPAIIHFFGMGLVLIHSPLLFLFSSRLFQPIKYSGIGWHFLPFLFFIFVMWISFTWHGDYMEFKNGFIVFKKNMMPLNYYGIFLGLISGIYTFSAFISIRRQKALLSQTQSGEIRNVLNWLEYWVIAAVVFFVLTYLIIELSVTAQQIDTQLTFQIINLFLSVYVIYVSYWAIRKTSAFQHLKPGILIDLEQGSHIAEPHAREVETLSNMIVGLLEKEKLYLNPDFSLTDLANAINVPIGKASFAINKGLGKNFYDLINSFRVREFQNKLETGKDSHLSLFGLAFDCGFRSKSTFNAFFKKETGMTPSAFKKSLEKKSG
ncbi:MAG: helix-turn-helix domain-containing protein [Flavobacterium sp.]